MNVLPMPATATFEDFWKQCPKKTGKPLAQVKWNAITNGGMTTRTMDPDSGTYVEITLQATPEEIIEGMKRYRKTQIDRNTYGLIDGGRFTLHPATFLNKGRWMDE